MYRVIRPFMISGDPEPNEKYRPWLEENIGIQGRDWHWDIVYTDCTMLEIHFTKPEHAILFELTWPRV